MNHNPENRNSMLVVFGKCYFCKARGHLLPRCSDRRLILFALLCVDSIARIDDMTALSRKFGAFVIDKALQDEQIVRAFSVRKCRGKISDSIDVCVSNTIKFFKPIIDERHYADAQNRYLNATTRVNNIREIARESDNIIPNLADIAIDEIDLNDMDVFSLVSILYDYYTSLDNDDDNVCVKLQLCDNNTESECECNICYEEYDTSYFVKLNCGHDFCFKCVKQIMHNNMANLRCCALCRTKIKVLKTASFKAYKELQSI